MGFGFFKAAKNKGQSKSPETSSTDLRRKNSRTSAPTNPSPRFLTNATPRAQSFEAGQYRTLDPKLDALEYTRTEGISTGFLDDVMFDFDSRLDLSGNPETKKPELGSKKEEPRFKYELVQKPTRTYTPKVYRLGTDNAEDKTGSHADASSSTPKKPSKNAARDGDLVSGIAEASFLFRKVKSSNEIRETVSPKAASTGETDAVKFNRRARQNPGSRPAAGRPLNRSSSRGRGRSRAPAKGVSADSSGTESEDDSDHVALAPSRHRSNSRARPVVQQHSDSNAKSLSSTNLTHLAQPKRSPSRIRGRSVGPFPSPPPSPSARSGHEGALSRSRSRSRMGRQIVPPPSDDEEDSESDEDVPLAGVRMQAIENRQHRGRRRVAATLAPSSDSRSQAVEPAARKSLDITPGRSSRRNASEQAPPPPTDSILPSSYAYSQQQAMAALAQQQQMWVAYYQQAAVYQQAAYQQMQQQQVGNVPSAAPYVFPGVMGTGMMPYGVLPSAVPAVAKKRSKNLSKKKSGMSLRGKDESVVVEGAVSGDCAA
ncbi:hypothetical protein SpCBS45565_g04052 [Spizellomyces sp. 'palustris']|nr:hypothetical protein SpCBS45565_g04052 [Spizellomyces sp. 'palustris']